MARSSNCQLVKADNQGQGVITKDIDIPTLKQEDVNMDFMVGLPRTCWQHMGHSGQVDQVSSIPSQKGVLLGVGVC